MQDENNPTPPGPAGSPPADTADRQLPVPVPDPSLTVRARRLAGNANCLNCGTALQGPFCHYCGQPDKNFLRFFPVLLRELLEDFIDFDSRFMRTMKPLLFRPGKLTRDYLDGRRFRYTPPLRLYLFSSIACFFILALLASDVVQINAEDEADGVVSGLQFGLVDDPEVQEALQELDPETRRQVDEALRKAAGSDAAGNAAPDATADAAADITADAGPEGEPGSAADGGDTGEESPIMIGDKPWNRETNPFVVAWLPDWVNTWINDEIEESPAKGRRITENPNLITDQVFDVLPATMFVLLPLVALLFKFWYLFSKKYYIEHLIFALHNHSFVFVVLLISVLLTALATWAEPAGEGRITTAVGWANVVIWVWVPVYFLVSLKRVYRQGWMMTIAKYCVLGLSYLALLVMTSGFVALLSFVLL